jgi:hypothetical protein
MAALEPHLDEADVVKASQIAGDGFVIGRRAQPASDGARGDPPVLAPGETAGGVEALQEDARR